jgi:hypothetical protein
MFENKKENPVEIKKVLETKTAIDLIVSAYPFLALTTSPVLNQTI